MKPNKQQQAILDLAEAPSREALVDWIQSNASEFAKYTRDDCGLNHASARSVAQISLELLESAIHTLRRYDEAGKRPLGQRVSDQRLYREVVPNSDFGVNRGTY